MKQGKVYIKDVFCGIISESEEDICSTAKAAFMSFMTGLSWRF